MLKHIDRDLHEWTEAMLKMQSGPLGFNKRSVIGRLVEEGCTHTQNAKQTSVGLYVTTSAAHWLQISGG